MFQKIAMAIKSKLYEFFTEDGDRVGADSDAEGFTLLDYAEDFIPDQKLGILKPDKLKVSPVQSTVNDAQRAIEEEVEEEESEENLYFESLWLYLLALCSPISLFSARASVAHFSQYKLTSLMLKRLKDLGFHVSTSPKSDGLELDSLVAKQILMGHECVAIHSNKESVTATVSFREGAKFVKRDIPCSILVGADGAGSAIRRLTEIKMRGERDLQKLVSIHFMSRELGEHLISCRPGMLFFIFNTQGT